MRTQAVKFRLLGRVGLSAKDSTPYWPPTVVPPKGAPNVLLIMTDDAGYGVSGTFGGVIPIGAPAERQSEPTASITSRGSKRSAGRRPRRVSRKIVEIANTGYPLWQELRDERLGPLVAYTPRDDKETRFAVQTAKIERGMILIPREADWLPAFKHELLAFPNGKNDDQVDSMTQFLDWIGRRRGRAKCERRLNGGRPLAPVRPQAVRRSL
jgi:hypothetical protein